MKKLLKLLFLLVLLAQPCLAIDLEIGEQVNIWIKVEERDGSSFTIQTASFSVLTSNGGVIQAESAASIDDDKVYGLVDASTAAFTPGLFAQVKFVYEIGDETYISHVPLQIFQYIHEE